MEPSGRICMREYRVVQCNGKSGNRNFLSGKQTVWSMESSHEKPVPWYPARKQYQTGLRGFQRRIQTYFPGNKRDVRCCFKGNDRCCRYSQRNTGSLQPYKWTGSCTGLSAEKQSMGGIGTWRQSDPGSAYRRGRPGNSGWDPAQGLLHLCRCSRCTEDRKHYDGYGAWCRDEILYCRIKWKRTVQPYLWQDPEERDPSWGQMRQRDHELWRPSA